MSEIIADDRRRVILAAAGKLFADKGVARTTTREIAVAAGMVSGSLYHYYPSKIQMVQELMRENAVALLEGYSGVQALNTDPVQELRGLIEISLKVKYEHPHVSEVYQAEYLNLAGVEGFEFVENAVRETEVMWLKTLSRGVEAGVFREDIPQPVFFRLVRDAMWSTVRWIESEDAEAFARLTDQCVSVFLNGIVKAEALAAR